MSYDVYLRAPTCPHCGHKGAEPWCPDPTYNLTPIFDLALTGEPLPNPDVGEAGVVLLGEQTDRPRGLRLLSGKLARDTIVMLEKALGHLQDPAKRDAFVALEPDNGWGDLAGATTVIAKLLEHARAFPDNTWEVR